MKDAAHHRRHVQRKVIQEARKELRNNKPFESRITEENVQEKKMAVRHQEINRLPGQHRIH